VTLTADEQYRMWVPLAEVSPTLTDAFLLKEDRWFFWHPGINPASLVPRHGATMSMTTVKADRRSRCSSRGCLRDQHTQPERQGDADRRCALARVALFEAADPRGVSECRPVRRQHPGCGAASRLYFGKPPEQLNLAEAITLAVIPQRPASRRQHDVAENMLAARARLGAQWLATHGNAADDRRQIDLPIVAQRAFNMPRQAPHFVDALLSSRRTAAARIDTTLDSQLQQLVELQVGRYLAGLADVGVHNATALLVDTRDTVGQGLGRVG
jgi:penicillin-binding protein 1C